MTGSKKVSIGNKVSSPKIVNIDYNIAENMKKTRENIFVYDLSKLTSQQDLILNAWKRDKEHSIKEKGKATVNFVKNITCLSKGKSSNLITTFNKIIASLNNAIIMGKYQSL